MAFVLVFIWGCHQEDFTLSGLANDTFFLQTDGQQLPITVGGNVSSGKMIVLIHGGPGGSSIVYRDSYVRANLESKFAVVYWDQRYAGSAQGKGGGSDISDFRRDIRKLIQLLKAKYGQDQQIYLLGHSWGGFLAPYFLLEPENQALVKGWIQVGGAHNYLLNDSLTREMLLFYGKRELAAERETAQWEEIVTWCENNDFRGDENAGQLNRFAHTAEGLIPEVAEPESDGLSFYLQNRVPIALHFFNQMNSGIRDIDGPTYELPISDNLHKITLPTLLLWGKYDFVCPPELADDIKANVGSRDVRFRLFEQSGHSPMMNERASFWQEVLAWVERH